VNPRHDPERDAAAFLGGALHRRAAERFEAHLVDCEECWSEVATARRGRSLAESLRELAPHELREDVRAAVAAAPAPGRSYRLVATLASAAVIVTAVSIAVVTLLGGTGQPAEIATALHEFRARVMPMDTPSGQAPDLSALGVRFVQGGSGDLGSMTVDAFAYRDGAGHRIVAYIGSQPSPRPKDAAWAAADGSWRARYGEIEMICTRRFILLADSGSPMNELARQLELSVESS